MATRFNKAVCSTATTRKESFLEGDVNNDNRILSLRMTRTCIESYRYHFHPQLPILHRSAFVADHAPNLLLLAIIAIGASTLDRIHGPEVIETVLRVGQFHYLASPMGGILDAEFQAPTKLWVYQALLFIEVHEKTYSTRFLHERAHIHHGTTLAPDATRRLVHRALRGLLGRRPAGLEHDARLCAGRILDTLYQGRSHAESRLCSPCAGFDTRRHVWRACQDVGARASAAAALRRGTMIGGQRGRRGTRAVQPASERRQARHVSRRVQGNS